MFNRHRVSTLSRNWSTPENWSQHAKKDLKDFENCWDWEIGFNMSIKTWKVWKIVEIEIGPSSVLAAKPLNSLADTLDI